MAIADIDFEGNGSNNQVEEPKGNPVSNTGVISNQEDVASLNGETDDINKQGEKNNQEKNDDKHKGEQTSSTGEVTPGTYLEIDDKTYKVADNGDIVDEKGNIFKEAKDIDAWLREVQVEEESDNQTLDVANIQEALGYDITDENGNAITFTNDVDGIKSLVESVIEVKSKELQEAAINKLYSDNPLLKQFNDYVQLNGSPRGFGEIPDRSVIQLDKDNENQLVAVIKMAAKEFGNKSINDSYINYLKESGALYDVAKEQLGALVDKDNQYKEYIEKEAAKQRDEEAKEVAEYWSNVQKAINLRVIGGYKIPDTFTKEVNGKKTILTPNDFFKYLSVPKEREDGTYRTDYQDSLNALSNEEYLNRELLDAWLMFTGGSYKDLIDMAVKEEEVRKLRIKSKESRSSSSVKIIKPTSKKASIDDIIF